VDAEEYLESRGITHQDLITRAGLREEDGRLYIPWLDEEGNEVYHTTRAMDDSQPRYKNAPGSRPPLWATPGAWEAEEVVLVEGFIDALAAAQAGFPAFAMDGASLMEDAIPVLSAKKRVTIVPDQDEAGRRARDEAVRKLSGKVELREVRLHGSKDLAEVAEATWAPVMDVGGLIESAKPVVSDSEEPPAPATTMFKRWDGSASANGGGASPSVGVRGLNAIDVMRLAAEQGDAEERFVTRGLIPEGSIILVAGEEGQGKTMLADQICRQVARQERVLGFFPRGRLPTPRILLVDVEQERAEAGRRSREMNRRGLEVPPDSLFWVCQPEGLDLAEDDQLDLLRKICLDLQIGLLWLDSGTNLVADPMDDSCVKQFFNNLARLSEGCSLAAIGITHHLRKRTAAQHTRRFDDLFGSRQWKGRPSKILYIERNRIVAWKDRGGHLRDVWPVQGAGEAQAVLERPGLDDPKAVPFRVSPKPISISGGLPGDDLEEKALRLVGESPDTHTKTALAGKIGGRRTTALDVVDKLVKEGRIGPDTPKAKLSLLQD